MKIPPRTIHESDLNQGILYSIPCLHSALIWRLSSSPLKSSHPSPDVIPRCPKGPWIMQYAVSVESTFILGVKMLVKACTILCNQCRFQLYEVWAAVRFPVVLPGRLTKGHICLLPNIVSSLKYHLDLGSNYNSRYTCKMILDACMFHYLLKTIEVQMPDGSCGVSKVNMLCADMISAAEVPVSPPGDWGRRNGHGFPLMYSALYTPF